MEHFDTTAGELLLGKLVQKNNGMLISTPKNPGPQKDAFENIYETHRAKWTRAELSKYPGSYFIRDSTHRVVYIGTKDNVQKLNRRILLERIRFIPCTKYFATKYVKVRKHSKNRQETTLNITTHSNKN